MPNLGRPIVQAGADELGDAVRQTIRAYHGSPYDFDRFDASTIGTGEGNQAYGHGLYFAENEDIAYGYRDNLGRAMTPEEQGRYDKLLEEQRDIIARSQRHYGRYPAGIIPPPEAGADRMLLDHRAKQNERELLAITARPGHMYEVEIGHPKKSMIDLDVPVRWQEGNVRDKIYDLGTPEVRSGDRFMNNSTLVNNRGQWYLQMDSGNRYRMQQHEIDALGGDRQTGRGLLQRLASQVGDAAASKELMRRGIPGVHYLDADSRLAGPGRATSNVVMFPGAEDSIRILRKYGLLAPMAAGAMQEQETPAVNR